MSTDDLQQQIAQLQQEVQRLSLAVSSSSLPARPQLVDTKLGKPSPFCGEPSKFEEFDFKLKAYVSLVDPRFRPLLERAEARGDETILLSSMDAARQQLAQELYYTVVMLTQNGALRIVKGVHDGNGAEAWRQLARRYNPQTLGRNLSRLTGILKPSWGDSAAGFMDALTQWEHAIDEYEASASDILADSVKCAIIIDHAPPAVKAHLLLNASTVQRYEEMKRIVENWLVANTNWSSGGAVPMDVGATGLSNARATRKEGKQMARKATKKVTRKARNAKKETAKEAGKVMAKLGSISRKLPRRSLRAIAVAVALGDTSRKTAERGRTSPVKVPSLGCPRALGHRTQPRGGGASHRPVGAARL